MTITTVKEALEAAKNHLYNGIAWADEPPGQSHYICHAATFAIAADAGVNYGDVRRPPLATLANSVESYVEFCLGEYSTAADLAVRGRGVPDNTVDIQAFRLAFIDELIAGLE